MSYRDDPAWRSALGETNEQNRARRDEQKRVAEFLRSDLYEPDHLAAENGEVYWRSPLGWVVRFQVTSDEWWVVIEQPGGGGELWRRRNATVHELAEALP